MGRHQPQPMTVQPLWQRLGLAIALLGLPACATVQLPWAATPDPEAEVPTPIASPVAPSPPPPSPVVIPADVLDKAATKATSAANLAKTAVTPDDWNLVLLQWQRAIALLTPIPRTHKDWQTAQQKLATYKKSLQQAQTAAKLGKTPPVAGANQPKANPQTIGLVALGDKTGGADIANIMVQLNQQQTAFWEQQQRFAKNLTELGNTVAPNAPDYTISTVASEGKRAISTAIAKQEGLPSYTGAVFVIQPETPAADSQASDNPAANNPAANNPASNRQPNGQSNKQAKSIILSIVCASQKPAKAAPGLPKVVNNQLQCPAGSVAVESANKRQNQQAIAP